MYALYNTMLFLASPFLFALLLVRLFSDRNYHLGLPQRFGFVPLPASRKGKPVIWFHAVSVGEVVAAEPLVRAIRKAYPAATLFLSTVTATGQRTALLRLPEIDQVFYFPFDFPGTAGRAIRRLSPDLFVFLETELWPNFLRALSRKEIPAVLVNGRISPRSYRRYRWVRPLAARVLGQVRLFLVQTERDAEHLLLLGADPEKVIQTGNQKYDQAMWATPPDPSAVRNEMGIRPGEKLWIAGSTHPGEERLLLAAFRRLLDKVPEMVLLLAPRHLERLPEVESDVAAAGLFSIRKSALCAPPAQEGSRRGRVILLDSLGELARLYAGADLVFIGGSLVPTGGHNLLEAAAMGKVVFFGPHMENFAEAAGQSIAQGCGIQVKDAEELAERLGQWIDAPARLLEGAARARRWVSSHRGAVEKNLEWILRLIPQT